MTIFLNMIIVISSNSTTGSINPSDNSNSEEKIPTYYEYFSSFLTEENVDIIFNVTIMLISVYCTYRRAASVGNSSQTRDNVENVSGSESTSSSQDESFSGQDPCQGELPDSGYNPLKIFLGYIDTLYTIFFG